ncbi:MAG TPA: flagellar basal body-associated FliL family protein [Spirochaetota bacterium]|nr:flagellar basal body-associated FliL family protein [Spirochaetota bacterium]
MADDKEDDIVEGEEGSDLGAQTQAKKGGFLSPFLVKILGIAAMVIAMIIVATIVSIIVINIAKPSSGGSSLPDVEDIKRTSVTHLEYLKFEDAFRQQLVDGRMIQLKIALGYKPKDKPLQTELSQIIPELRDIIIKQLSRLRSEYFADENALDRLEEDLLKQINRIVNTGKVERIYFQEYTLM